MKRIGVLVAVVTALCVALPAQAQVSFDLKAGYALPTGDLAKFGEDPYYGPLSNTWSGAIPIGVAGRYHFSPNLSAGVYFQYSPAFVSSRFCVTGMTCSAYDMRVGVEAVYGFLPERSLNPWVSLGTGWEWSSFSVATSSITSEASSNVTYSGWEYFNVQIGLDWNVSRTFAFGPYAGYFGGSYTTKSGTLKSTTLLPPSPEVVEDVSSSIPSEYRAFHGWIQLGLKGTVNL